MYDRVPQAYGPVRPEKERSPYRAEAKAVQQGSPANPKGSSPALALPAPLAFATPQGSSSSSNAIATENLLAVPKGPSAAFSPTAQAADMQLLDQAPEMVR